MTVATADALAVLSETSAFLEAGKVETPLVGGVLPETLKGQYALPFTTLSAAVENVPAQPDYLWHGLLAPYALTVQGGKPKDGKTTLMFGLIAALERGVPFLGLPTQKTRTMVLTEERPATLAEKRERWDVDPVMLFRHDVGLAVWPQVVEEATRCCHANGIRLLVVDTIAEFSSTGGDSENNSGAVLEQMRPLQQAASSGLAVLAIHHFKKGSAEGWDAFRGSGAFQGVADILIGVSRKGESFRQIKAEGRFSAIPTTLTYTLGDSGFETADIPTECDSVHVALGRLGSATKEHLAEELGITPRAVGTHLSALYSSERIGRTGEGKRGDPFVYHAAVSGSAVVPLAVSTFPASSIPLFEEAA